MATSTFDDLALQYVVLDDEVVMRDLAAKAAKGLLLLYYKLLLCLFATFVPVCAASSIINDGQVLPFVYGSA